MPGGRPTAEQVEFVGAAGARLSGVLHLPADPASARGSVLLTHCFTCSKDLHTMTRLAKGLSAEGYAVLRFDFTGLGDSGGAFSRTSLATNLGDIRRAAATLVERGYGPCGMVGHSLGGAAALLAAPALRTVRSMAIVGAPSTPGYVRRLFSPAAETVRDGEVLVEIAGRPFPISRAFLEALDAYEPQTAIAGLGRPLLVLHAVDDEIVEVAEGERIFSWARQPKAFVPLLGTDHLLTSRHAAEIALHALADWFGQTLQPPSPSSR